MLRWMYNTSSLLTQVDKGVDFQGKDRSPEIDVSPSDA